MKPDLFISVMSMYVSATKMLSFNETKYNLQCILLNEYSH